MSSIEITDEQHDRIIALRDELTAVHGGPYTSATVVDVVAYLLDLADAVDDPKRQATIDTTDTGTDEPQSFPREELKAELETRNRRHTDADSSRPMGLYSIATEYEISGRSDMTKQELITAILDTVERRYTDPLAPVDIDLFETDTESVEQESEPEPEPPADTDDVDAAGSESAAATNEDEHEDSGAGQLSAMLDLLDTHSDKWGPGDGDARYQVELPDGSVESARTKDDVRATLFKHY